MSTWDSVIGIPAILSMHNIVNEKQKSSLVRDVWVTVKSFNSAGIKFHTNENEEVHAVLYLRISNFSIFFFF